MANCIFYRGNGMKFWGIVRDAANLIIDRFTNDFEYLFFFVKNKNYYFEQQFEPITESYVERTKYAYSGNKGNADRFWIGQPNGKKEINPLGRNKRTVWNINPEPSSDIHFAHFPTELIRTPILACCPKDNGIVMDIFFGSGTTGIVAEELGRNWIGMEINPDYVKLANERIRNEKILRKIDDEGDKREFKNLLKESKKIQPLNTFF